SKLDEIACCLNVDMVGVGDRFALRRQAGTIWELAAAEIGGSSPACLPIVQTETMPSSDHWAFHELGVPSAQLTREPDSAWRSPADALDRYSVGDLDDAEAVAVALLRSVVKSLKRGGTQANAGRASYGENR